MKGGVEPIKKCLACGCIIPFKATVCSFCKFEFQAEKLSEEETKMPYSELCTQIDNAFFRLESFMRGSASDYESFDFANAFTVLLLKTRQPQNYTVTNVSLLSRYWKLTQQISVDFDKSNFENLEAYKNDAFCRDCEVISSICYNRVEEFCEFITEEERAEAEKKYSVEDIHKLHSNQNNSSQTKQEKPDHHQQIDILLRVFEYNYPCYLGPIEFYHQAQSATNDLKAYILKLLPQLEPVDKTLFLLFVKNRVQVLLKYSAVKKSDLSPFLDKYSISYEDVFISPRDEVSTNEVVRMLNKRPSSFEETFKSGFNSDEEMLQFHFYNYWYGMFLGEIKDDLEEMENVLSFPLAASPSPLIVKKEKKSKKDFSYKKFFRKIKECTLTQSEIYQTVEKKTDSFNIEKLKILKKDFDFYLFVEKEEYEAQFTNEDIQQAILRCKERGREVPQRIIPDLTKDENGKPVLIQEGTKILDIEQLLFPAKFFCCYQFQAFLETEIRKLELNLPDRDYSRFNKLSDPSRYNIDYNSLVSTLMKTYDVEQLEMILGGELKKIKKMSREGFEENKGDFYQSYKARANWIENTILICDNEFQYTKRLIFKSVIKWCEEWRDKYLPLFDPYSPEEKEAMHKDLFKPLWQQLDGEGVPETVEPDRNDFIKSTIEDYLFPFKESGCIRSGDYDIVVQALHEYFENKPLSKFPSVFVKGKIKKKLGYSFGQLYRSLRDDAICFPYLSLLKQLIQFYNDEMIDENRINKSTLYKYLTTKTQ